MPCQIQRYEASKGFNSSARAADGSVANATRPAATASQVLTRIELLHDRLVQRLAIQQWMTLVPFQASVCDPSDRTWINHMLSGLNAHRQRRFGIAHFDGYLRL